MNKFPEYKKFSGAQYYCTLKVRNKIYSEVKLKMAKTLVPEAKEAMERFKMEAASEVGVNLKQGYNGDLTSKQAGSVGGQMVNLMMPEQQWKFQRINRNAYGHCTHITLSMVAGL